MRKLTILAAAVVLLPALALADTFTDTFDGGLNVGGWQYNPGDVIEAAGGNPGAWLHNDNIDNFAVIFRGAVNAPFFTGDYAAMGVTNISFDGRLDNENIPMYMSILLRDQKGTPAQIEDDDYAYLPNGLIPQIPGQWESYDFPIPSQATDLPAGWTGAHYFDSGSFSPGYGWDDLMANVERVEIWFWHPAYFGIFRIWDAGIDNVAITTEGTVSIEPTTWGNVKGLYR